MSGDTQQLIEEYGNYDDAIFFLGRLVWQGEMDNCVEHFIEIALDGRREIHVRRVSVRAVMTCGSAGQKQRLWQKLNGSDAQIPREMLSELIEKAEPDSHSVEHLLVSLGKLPPYKRFKATGLNRSLQEFVERLPLVGDQLVITQLLDGLHAYLGRPPFVERQECRVSREYAWLLSSAAHAVERLVKERSSEVFGRTALSIVLMVPALRYWRDNNRCELKNNLQELVPGWSELNDTLYWASIEQARSAKAENSSEPLTDDWSLSWLGHFWDFDTASLPRLLTYMRSRELQDDRLVALSTAFRVYVKGWSGPKLCERLRNQLAGDYLREESAGCGVMLLVWQGKKSRRRWKIDSHRFGLDELANALKLHWRDIAEEFPGVDAIDVIVIDLNQRAQVSDS